MVILFIFLTEKNLPVRRMRRLKVQTSAVTMNDLTWFVFFIIKKVNRYLWEWVCSTRCQYLYWLWLHIIKSRDVRSCGHNARKRSKIDNTKKGRPQYAHITCTIYFHITCYMSYVIWTTCSSSLARRWVICISPYVNDQYELISRKESVVRRRDCVKANDEKRVNRFLTMIGWGVQERK